MSGSIASGLNRRLVLAPQSGGLKARASAGGGRILRRNSATQNLSIDGFGSQEILQSQQIRDYRNGVGRGGISYASNLVPGSAGDFFEALLRRNYAAVTPYVSIAITAGTTTLTRATGSWITDGFRFGMVISSNGWAAPATANNNRSLRIIGITDLVLTFAGVKNEVLVAKAAGDSVTVSVVGKVTFTPASGHTNPYYTYEDLLPDLATPSSDVYEDVRWQSLGLSVPSTGIAMLQAQGAARDVISSSTAYFTAPTAVSNVGSVAGVSGLLRLNGADVAYVTQMGIQMGRSVSSEAVIGSNRVPDIVLGPLSVQGSLSAYLLDVSLITAWKAETVFELVLKLDSDQTVNSPFVCITLPALKLTNVTKNDSPTSLMQQATFLALENIVTTGGMEATSFMVQDSAL